MLENSVISTINTLTQGKFFTLRDNFFPDLNSYCNPGYGALYKNICNLEYKKANIQTGIYLTGYLLSNLALYSLAICASLSAIWFLSNFLLDPMRNNIRKTETPTRVDQPKICHLAQQGSFARAEIGHLLSQGVDIDTQDNDGNTPLALALQKGDINMALFLLDRGANLLVENYTGKMALINIIDSDKPALVTFFIYNYVHDIQKINHQGQKALFALAAKQGNFTRAEYLIKNFNIDINTLLDAEKNTALIYAAFHGNKEAIKRFFRYGALINHRNADGNHALIHAVLANQLDAIKALLEKGASRNLQNYEGISAVNIASSRQLLQPNIFALFAEPAVPNPGPAI